MKKRIKIVQQLLQEKGLYDGIIDGIAGPVTMSGLSRFEELDKRWSGSRQLIA
jgi:peptidoglycan hydrolase-like protein with peptidoglycan-binding domain